MGESPAFADFVALSTQSPDFLVYVQAHDYGAYIQISVLLFIDVGTRVQH